MGDTPRWQLSPSGAASTLQHRNKTSEEQLQEQEKESKVLAKLKTMHILILFSIFGIVKNPAESSKNPAESYYFPLQSFVFSTDSHDTHEIYDINIRPKHW